MRWLLALSIVSLALPVGVRAEDVGPRIALRMPSNDAPTVAATATPRRSSSPATQSAKSGSSPPAPWLRLELDSAGLRATPLASRSRRTEPGLSRGAKIGLGVAIPIFVVGVGFAAGAAALNNNLSSGF
jgi:hypothetical protein